MIWCKTDSFAGRSISLLWILISKLSKVALPEPHGDFLVVILNFFVGRGIGPLIGVPDFLATLLIDSQIVFKTLMSVLFNFILTFGI